ncbi:hypothetical protein SCLCIDRAFT_186651 [Scleroderma citrinum Foug A]|uniref:Uncharacterized protein n=1 Tax=Scleroderma citrinum Foug A TaxID=1036808 RepID=A0A0C3D911_9AGAM|nr:hypothetical protein SCLCIDRAFT_186651 [Scleroderma citrinum Foug A]
MCQVTSLAPRRSSTPRDAVSEPLQTCLPLPRLSLVHALADAPCNDTETPTSSLSYKLGCLGCWPAVFDCLTT